MNAPNPGLRQAVREHLVREVDASPRTRASARRSTPRWPIAVAVALVSLTLIGAGAVAAFVSTARAQHDRPAQPTPTSTPPAAEVEGVPQAENGIIGTGTFDGAVRGRFTITYRNGISTMHLEATALGSASARSVELATSTDAVGCSAEGIAVYFGSIGPDRLQDVGLAEDVPVSEFSDLSNWSAIGILPAEGVDDACDTSTYTIATIHWHLPAAILSLGERDGGAEAAARGDVQVKNGRPVRYTVAADDQIEAVAARFGMTADDLFYLNPFRRHGTDPELYAGEILNLDPTDRAYFSP